jgi:Tol biopolymer transport system component
VIAVSLILLSLAGGIVSTVWFYRSQSETPAGQSLTVVPITSYPGYEEQSSFSPEGDRIAFVWEGETQVNKDIYVKSLGTGPPLRLTSDAATDLCPAWSPDGRWIAFFRELTAERAAVMLIPASGGQERPICESELPLPFRHREGLAWSPDGKFIAVPDKDSAGPGLRLVSLETRETRKLTAAPNGFVDHTPAIAPDGSSLAFIRANNSDFGEIYIQRLTSTLIPDGEPLLLNLEGQSSYSLAWTPDAREIVFAAGLPDGMTLWRMPVSGFGKPQRLASVGEPSSQPAISRLGRRLAYTHNVWDEDILRVRLADPHTPASPPAKFLSSTRPDSGPQYSPDGRKIAFASTRSSRSGNYEIWVCNSDGEAPIQLTSLNAESGSPRWSPDSQRLVFDSNVEGQWEIFSISVNGGQPQRLTVNAATDSVPSWSADGNWVYFASDRSGESQVWKMPATGGDPVQITTKGGIVAFESPDGNYVYYSKKRRISSLWRLPVDGGVESEVLTSVAYRAFAILREGIYFVSKPPSGSDYLIQFLDFASGKTRRVVKVGTSLPSCLTLSPNRQWLLYAQLTQAGSDLMLAENFR